MEDENYEIIERVPTVEEYLALREAVGWETKDTHATQEGLVDALFTVCALYGGNVIGCARVIGDVGLYFYVQDVIVLPQFQSKGLGKRLMERIVKYLDEHARPGSFVGLMAAEGASDFCRQFGFAVTRPGRPGMFRYQGVRPQHNLPADGSGDAASKAPRVPEQRSSEEGPS